MIYIFLVPIAAVLIAATLATVSKAGKTEGICKYGKDE